MQDHDTALSVLRVLNNNPEVFRKDQRPIVEFSIENRKALNARQKRLEKSREKNPNFAANNKENGASDGDSSEPPKAKRLKKAENEDEGQGDKPRFMGSASKPNQKNLPSHVGPKIRHKQRPTKISRKNIRKEQQLQKNPKKRKQMQEALNTNAPEAVGQGQGRKATETSDGKSKKKKKAKKTTKAEIKDLKEEKKFTNLVSAYKQKLISSQKGLAGKKRKWYE